MNAPNGPALLNDLSDFIVRFVALSHAQADVCALWVAHTHAFKATEFTPYLNITSPLPRSGKTTLLQLLTLLVANPWYTGRVTPAVLVRKTDKDHPTLLLDESDAAFQANREYTEVLRGVLNSGYELDGTYSMCVQVKKDWVPKDFSTFCPKAIAGIGKLPDTVEDRSIPISLKRKLPSEKCEGFRKRKVRPDADALRASAAKWATRNIKPLGEAEPDMPGELNDRQQDVCEPLIAIADLVGGEWPERARKALISLLGVQVEREDSQGVRLLADTRFCFEKYSEARMKSTVLLDRLNSIEESPWREFYKGFPLTLAGLARMLKPFDIRPRDLRFDGGVFKGYERSDFEDAWTRYLGRSPLDADPEGQHGQQAAIYVGSGHFSKGQHEPFVALAKSEESPVNTRFVAGVAAFTPPSWDDLGKLGPLKQNEPPSQPNGKRCVVHPLNQTRWWLREGDWICEQCHPTRRSPPD